MSTSTPSTLTAADAAKLIASKTTLGADVPTDVRRAAVAQVIAKGGTRLSARVARADKIVPSLVALEGYAGLEGEVTRTWLALRALNLGSGSQIAVSDAALADPIVDVLISATSLVPTTDADAQVRGVLGDLGGRDESTLAAGARLVAPDADPSALVVANSTGPLFTVALDDALQAAMQIDAHAHKPRVSSGIGPLAYNTVPTAELSSFTTSVFATYKVRRVEVPGAAHHPTDLVESAALSSVLPPVPAYQPHFHPEIVSKGILSDVQLESVIYAGEAHSHFLPAHPDDDTKTPPRQGFLVGHGTGVGKGRIIAGIIADNWAQGRRRHLWFSESARLIDDARRDWEALGGRPEDIVDVRELSSEGPIEPFNGVIFATYAALRAENDHGARVDQLIEWFGHGEEGCIMFDEAQNLRNAKSSKSKKQAFAELSQQGQAALDLQDALPNARVTYVTATSASDIGSMGYAIRLGMWGAGTAFRTAHRFFQEMEQGGTNALEMVARDLKQMGLYLAANLSFEGVHYERLNRKLTAEERDAQDRLAQTWLDVADGLKRAMSYTGASHLPSTTRGRMHKMGSIHFSMARARFFQALLASLNTPQMIDSIRQDLANGDAVVVQMTNTFAANAERAITEAEDQGQSLDQVEASAKDILLGYLRNGFPTVEMTRIRKNGKFISTPVTDAQGNPVHNAKAVQLRDQLIAQVDSVEVPESPLEQLMRAFGPDMVAEITGRSRRLVPQPNGTTVLEDRSPSAVKDDVKAFMDDMKQILVFSTAGATGATYSAQRTVRNQRKRRHYVLQPGWRADLALQGMGRSHRSNQVQPPEYILLTTDLWANQRMISAVAKGMRDLGALTRGLRQAASQDFFTQDDNLEDEFGETAWQNFVTKLSRNQIPGLSIGQFEREACIPLRTKQGLMVKPLPPVKRFLNAMSAMSCDNQALFGQHYRAELQELKLAAIEEGSFDRGIETIVPDSLIKLEDAVVYRHPRTGAETRLLKMLRIDELDPVPYAEARRKAALKGTARVVKSALTGRIAILGFPRSRGRAVLPTDKVEVIMPTGSRIRTREEVVQERWMPVDVTMAEQLWGAELRERGDEEEREFWVISGAMLPIWDKLPRQRTQVYRMETDEGEQIIGRLVSEDFVDKFLKRVDALTSGGLTHQDVDDTLMQAGVVTLANGWVLEGRYSTITDRRSIVLSMPVEDEAVYGTILTSAGLTKYVGPMATAAYWKLPLDDAERARAIGTILGESPAVGAAAL